MGSNGLGNPLLYPLSYAGANAQLACQRVPTSDRAYQPVLRAVAPTGRAHMEHTEPVPALPVPTSGN